LVYFKNINFNNYRNFSKSSLSFEKGCNIIIGRNGSGKSNVLEGISLFEKGRGFRRDLLKNMININNPKEMFLINSNFSTQENDLNLLLLCELNDNKLKKKLLVNGSHSKENVKYFERLYSIIYFLPEMERFFLNSPTVRRSFLDRLINNTDKNYYKLIFILTFMKKYCILKITLQYFATKDLG